MPEQFASLPEGASPFAFPVSVGDKQGTLDRLARRGVVALNFWLVRHPALPAPDFPHAAALRKSVIGLPVHQELGERELAGISAALFESL